MSDVQQVDLVVVGLGPGGETLANVTATAGLAVVAVDKHLVGGECPYYGCVPSKMMIRGSTLIAETRRADPYAGRSSIEPDLAFVAQRIRDEATDDWDDTVAADRFTGKGGRLVRGSARLDGPGRVVAGDDTFVAARGVVVASGSAPVVPPIDGLAVPHQPELRGRLCGQPCRRLRGRHPATLPSPLERTHEQR